MAATDSIFKNIKQADPIEVFELVRRYKEDPDPTKVNLSVGAYRDNDGNPWVLPVVRAAEAKIAADTSLNHEYLPVPGSLPYTTAATRLLLGEDCAAITEGRTGAVQGIGGTGAIRSGLDFLYKQLNYRTVLVSKPTWGNHKGISKSIGYTSILEYRYWDEQNKCVDITGLLEDLRSAPDRSVVLLHMVAHNPTGMDPSHEQWLQIGQAIKEKNHFTFFDCAYQGFATGDVDVDAWPVRQFVRDGHEMLCAQSFSKNFGLYNERVGNLTFVTNDPASTAAVKSQIAIVVRTTVSNSPAHGCQIVGMVLSNKNMFEEWKAQVKIMAGRISDNRQMLLTKLREKGTPGDWSHITKQIGMFSYTGLNERQCEFLINERHIYLMKSGRINMCALTTKNIDHVVNSIHEAVTNIQ